jgi:hypothetical protein
MAGERHGYGGGGEEQEDRDDGGPGEQSKPGRSRAAV